MKLSPLVEWFARNGSLRVWFWFVGVIGLLPIMFRIFRYHTMLDVFGTGELLIVSTLVCGTAVERSLSLLQLAVQSPPPPPRKLLCVRIMQDCMCVCIVLMIISCAWYGHIESQGSSPSERVVWPSITIALFAYLLGGIVVWLDASRISEPVLVSDLTQLPPSAPPSPEPPGSHGGDLIIKES